MRLNPSIMADAATAVAGTAHGVKPDQLGAPTPCTDWRVRSLANHLLQVATALTIAGQGGPVPHDIWERDLMSEDWADRLERQSREAAEAWTEPAAWEGMVGIGSAEMPAAVVASMLTSDLVIHGWDLARATGQEYSCLDDTAEMARVFVEQMGEQGRSMGIFAEPVPVPEQAKALDKALSLSGRDPAWTP